MMITGVGGLGSIILGVAITAVALKLVRTMNAHPAGARRAEWIYSFVLFGSLLISSAAVFVATYRDSPARVRAGWRRFPRIVQVLLVVLLLLAGLYGLALLGYAAGLK